MAYKKGNKLPNSDATFNNNLKSQSVDLDRGSMQQQLFLWTDSGQGWRLVLGVEEGVAGDQDQSTRGGDI